MCIKKNLNNLGRKFQKKIGKDTTRRLTTLDRNQPRKSKFFSSRCFADIIIIIIIISLLYCPFLLLVSLCKKKPVSNFYGRLIPSPNKNNSINNDATTTEAKKQLQQLLHQT